jgi:3-methyladenine DNA glycosylase AlkD
VGYGGEEVRPVTGKSVPEAAQVLHELQAQANPDNVAGMARYGISVRGTLGVPMPALRELAREIKRAAGRGEPGASDRHALASELWATAIHEARILAALVDVPELVTEDQMESWVLDLDSWDVCDQLCNNLFDKTEWSYEKAHAWADRDEEFVKRAGFVLMATLAVHDKKAGDERFLEMLPVIERNANDGRNFVKKAVNWSLRQIGKRNLALNAPAVQVAERLAGSEDKAERWVGNDALKELTSPKVRERLSRRG